MIRPATSTARPRWHRCIAVQHWLASKAELNINVEEGNRDSHLDRGVMQVVAKAAANCEAEQLPAHSPS